MGDNLQEQIYNNLIIKDTEDLLEIWHNGDLSEWEENVFEMIEQILKERLGHVPTQSNQAQVRRLLRDIEGHLDQDEIEPALSKCELAIQMDPNSALAFNYRGEIYDQRGELEAAIADYQRAIQLDPFLEVAWENMRSVEAQLEERFETSETKGHLDQALEYAYGDEAEKALAECQLAGSNMPRIAVAYNYLGLILQTLDQLEASIEAYLKAIELNPRLYAARENLANARVVWEEDQYLEMTHRLPDEVGETETGETELDVSLDEDVIAEDNRVPGWVYLNADSFLLPGWPGYRNRPGRSGYDPLDRDFEFAHVQGLILRRLMTGSFRTRNPIYLLLMTYLGVVNSAFGILAITSGNGTGIFTGLVYSPYLIAGIRFLANVFMSLSPDQTDEREERGYTFF
jgi:tetratricopeptide (TPR) repeat protein